MNRVERTPVEATPFTDRVMGALAVAPVPTPTRTFLSAIRVGAVQDAFAALWVAWHLSTVRAWQVAPRVRARSFALVLAVATVLGTGSLAAAAAVHVVVPQRILTAPASDPDRAGVDEQDPVSKAQSGTDDGDEVPTIDDGEPGVIDDDGDEPDEPDRAGEDTDGTNADDEGQADPGDPDELDQTDVGDADGVNGGGEEPGDPDELDEPDQADDEPQTDVETDDGARGGDDGPG